ncbi:shikimate kinase [Candidatus Peregrinibacteria bacterium]|nr:shikimate kinase [Candidatus Peregrinibacteria bacterium]
MNIILIGLRGSGKSILGKILSKKLQLELIDQDKVIEENEGMTIAKIVELRGWEYFRAIESKITGELTQKKNKIIATGGGVILDPDNRKALKQSGKVIYLYRKPEECIKYIKDDPNRPPLTNQETLEEEMKQLYKERNSLYCKTAHKIFHRSENLEKDAEELVNSLLSK